MHISTKSESNHAFTHKLKASSVSSGSENGFTLIELLVVIAIIGILSSVVLASLSGARESARDARRVSDFRQFRQAMELYYLDNGEYPAGSEVDKQVSENCAGTQLYNDLVVGGYLTRMITDPAEDFVRCDDFENYGIPGDYAYSWNNSDNQTGYRACFAINSFETSNGVAALSGANQQSAPSPFGWSGNLARADFVHCFEK